MRKSIGGGDLRAKKSSVTSYWSRAHCCYHRVAYSVRHEYPITSSSLQKQVESIIHLWSAQAGRTEMEKTEKTANHSMGSRLMMMMMIAEAV
jgi:hypothetical protein